MKNAIVSPPCSFLHSMTADALAANAATKAAAALEEYARQLAHASTAAELDGNAALAVAHHNNASRVSETANWLRAEAACPA